MPLGVRHVDLKQIYIYMVWFIIGTSGDILVHNGDRMVYRCVYIYTSDMFATNITFKLVSRSGEFPFCDNYAGENDDKPLHLGIPILRQPHTDLHHGMEIAITG